jgi:hypothetical protein
VVGGVSWSLSEGWYDCSVPYNPESH